MAENHKLILASFPTIYHHLLSQIKQQKMADPLAEMALVLPNSSAIKNLRLDLPNTIRIHLYQFYTLAEAVLLSAAYSVQPITDSAVSFLIRTILENMAQEESLSTFVPMINKPGFIDVLLSWLREMKSQGIHPDDYLAMAQSNPNERDQQLADFYCRYQNHLNQHDLADPDGILWLAAEVLENSPQSFVHDIPLTIIGHDQFTPVELRIIKALSACYPSLTIYLSWDVNRSENSLALSRLQATRKALVNLLPVEEVNLHEEKHSSVSLSTLQQNIFDRVEPISTAEVDVDLIEAPSRDSEVRAVLRAIKQLLIDGASPQSIAILVPKSSVYQPIIKSVSQEYGLPLSTSETLAMQPLVMDLINFLQLAPDFLWGPVFQAIRSAYGQQLWLTPEQIDLLDRLSREQPVLEGRDQWLSVLQIIEEPSLDNDDEDHIPSSLLSTLSPEEIQALKSGLEAFFDHLTPPPQASYQSFVWWVQTALLGVFPDVDQPDQIAESDAPSINMLSACQQSPQSVQDLQVLDQVLSVLQNIIALHKAMDPGRDVAWEGFQQEFLTALHTEKFEPEPYSENVFFGALPEGRYRLVDHLFILGLSEGEFPLQPAADVFYAPDERASFTLPIRQFIAAHDASLFWQVLSNVQSHLTLLRPYIDENGAQWQPSPYWQSVQACFSNLKVTQIPIAVSIKPGQAASIGEFLVSMAQNHALNVPAELQHLYTFVQQAETIHAQRNSSQPPGIFEGLFRSGELVEQINRQYSEDHVWSASRLNTYANCPFNFFAQNLLGLEAREQPEDGLNAMQRGSLLHRLLEKTFILLKDQEIPLDSDHLDQVMQTLDQACAQVFPRAAYREGFRPGQLWAYEQKELRRLLHQYLTWECQENPQNYQPYLQEARFGFKDSDHEELQIQSSLGSLMLRGVIDRIDRNPQGYLRVIDYKSGSTTYSIKKDVPEGLALQSALYARAAEEFWVEDGQSVGQSEFRHLSTRKASGGISFSTPVKDDPIVLSAIEHTFKNVSKIRAGIFPSATTKAILGRNACTAYCDYAPLCRVSRQSILKAKREGLV